MHLGLADQHVGGHVIVVVQQDLGLDATFGATKRGPGKQAEAQTDDGGIKRQQFVLKPERVCARAEMALGTESVRHRPEQVFEDRGGTMCVGVGQVGLARTPVDTRDAPASPRSRRAHCRSPGANRHGPADKTAWR